jgi:large subunit ribosomal protein L21
MYAIIRDGSHQHRVEEGQTVRLAYRADAEPGSTLEFGEVLAVGEGADLKVGAPTVEGASVSVRVTAHRKDKKIVVYHFQRRKNHHKKQGHRQRFTEAVIEKISG